MTHDNSIPVALSKREFDEYPSFKGGAFWLEERAWFRLGGTLGIAILDHADNDWSFVVLRQDKAKADLYCAVDLGSSFATQKAAIKALSKAMARAEKTGSADIKERWLNEFERLLDGCPNR
jgi:hypothetical protein